ncbi:hypothetical protein [Amycolatopsis thailandensis]|uniref:hypothetical protein n=1 Tax=Amycolatopsis thailandensis TaxID=589330 RepID=UPI00362C9933
MTMHVRWTAHSAMALKSALNLNLVPFAEHLGLSPSTVNHWSAPGSSVTPGREAQELLTVALDKASGEVKNRFWAEMAAGTSTGTPAPDRDPRDLGGQIRDGAAQSMTMADEASQLATSDEQLAYLRDELCRIAVAYVHTPLSDVVEDLRDAQKTLAAITQTRHRPRSAREATVLSGVLCLLFAHASQNAGDQKSALQQLRSATTFANVADSDALRTWTLGSAALMLEWSARPGEAADRARNGLQYRVSTQSHQRLLAIVARSAARAGDAPAARDALAGLADLNQHDATHGDEVVGFGGLLSFPEAKLTYYQGGTLTLLGDHAQAEIHSARAIERYETGPDEDRSYGDEALARLDVTRARLGQDDVTGALAAAEPVLTLDTRLRIRQIDNAISLVRADALALAGRRHRDAGQLTDRLTGYLTAARQTPRALPSASG